MNRLGMDVDAVESAGRALKAHADRIDGIIRALDRSVKSLGPVWQGATAQRFIQRTWPAYRTELVAAREHIAGLGQSALNNASEQRGVSRGSGGTAGSTSGGAIADSTRGVIAQFKDPRHADDLYWIDEVIGPDGARRFVVFINGTRGDVNPFGAGGPQHYFEQHGWAWNIPASANSTTIASIAIQNAMHDRIGDSTADVMIVGYSQGGMIAQQIADQGHFSVKEVMTVASPAVLGDHGYGGANVTRLEHGGDEVVNGTSIARGLSWIAGIADPSSQVLARNAFTPLLTGDGSIFNGSGEVHTFHQGHDEPAMVHDVGTGHYDWLADRYDESTDPDIAAARERQALYLRGEVVTP